MDNRSTFQLFATLFFISAFGEILELSGIVPNNYVFTIGLSLLRLTGIILIIQSGTILKARPYIQFIYFLIGLVIIGSMLKVMHWPFGNLIITAGLTAIVFVYTIRFIKKVTKKQLDILKLLWLMVFCFAAVFKINHWPWGNILLTMQTGFFLLLLFSFLYGLMQKNKSVA